MATDGKFSLQELLAVLHEPCPLQALIPKHFTPSALAGAAVRPMLPAIIMAAAVAANVVLAILRIEVIAISRGSIVKFARSDSDDTSSRALVESPLCEIWPAADLGLVRHSRFAGNVAKLELGRYVGQSN